MRLFIACEIPEQVRKKLVTLQEDIGEEQARIKWVEMKNIHLTMKFLGEVDDGKVEEIKSSLSKIKSKAIDAHVSGFGVFPNESYVRVMWVGLEPAHDLGKLHDGIDAALSSLGFGTDSSFRPHVTLGRVRSVMDKNGLMRKIAEAKESLADIGSKFRIDEFKLKKSTLTPRGPVYEDVAVVVLS
ncbi:MAG: RNA 2',3'-cyclic phosphodiesterase [Candidatus Aenigmarchaeota archaeon]|nr:RNA 2',3'-cyclic phosphodiesterase [Candidatus Aenigmarchaeota archaeon]